MKNYSFIVPHHNFPELLNRCIDNIPQREDIEIIVIDDNSTSDKKPQINRSDVRIIYIDAEHTKGAGRARNYGLKEAKGKWIVFADCDDFYVPGFMEVLDMYKDEDVEVVYYDATAADTVTLEPMPELLRRHNKYFSDYDGSDMARDTIKFRLHSPWWKMVRRDFIEKYHIQFEECPKGNDVLFSYQVGYFAKKMAVEKEQLYVYTYNKKGITNGKKSKKINLEVLRNILKMNEFFKFINHPEWKNDNKLFWLKIIKHDGLCVFVDTLLTYLINYQSFLSTRMDYVDGIKSRIVNK